jgi:hypothetical protein
VELKSGCTHAVRHRVHGSKAKLRRLMTGCTARLGDHLMFKPWMRLAVDTTLLGLEAQTVVGIRLSQIALGQGSPAESQLMVSEKMLAFAEAASTVAAGGSVHKVVKNYRRHVRANVRRLSR